MLPYLKFTAQNMELSNGNKGTPTNNVALAEDSRDQRGEPAKVRHVEVRGDVCLEPRHLTRQRELVRADLLRLGQQEVVVPIVCDHA